MGKKLNPLEQELADIWSVAAQVATKDYRGAKLFTDTVLQHMITHWPGAAAEALGDDLPVYQSMFSARTKAAGAQSPQISAPTPADADADRELAVAVRTVRAAGFSDVVNLAIVRLARHIAAIPSVLGRKKSASGGLFTGDNLSRAIQNDPTVWL